MARALRVVSVERGIDPRELALVAFGGAGPLHACALAEELGCGGARAARLGRAQGARARGRPTCAATTSRRRPPVRGAAARARPRTCRARSRGGRRRPLPRPVARADGRRRRLGGGAFHAAHERRYGYRQTREPSRSSAARGGDAPRDAPSRGVPGAVDDRRAARARSVDGAGSSVPVLGPGAARRRARDRRVPEATCLLRPAGRAARRRRHARPGADGPGDARRC